jgi:hypothetical protein
VFVDYGAFVELPNIPTTQLVNMSVAELADRPTAQIKDEAVIDISARVAVSVVYRFTHDPDCMSARSSNSHALGPEGLTGYL